MLWYKIAEEYSSKACSALIFIIGSKIFKPNSFLLSLRQLTAVFFQLTWSHEETTTSQTFSKICFWFAFKRFFLNTFFSLYANLTIKLISSINNFFDRIDSIGNLTSLGFGPSRSSRRLGGFILLFV